MREKIFRKQLLIITLFSTLLLLPFAVKAREAQPLNIESVKCPVVGQKPTYVGGSTPYTDRYEERWVNLTDHKVLESNETFEANKQYYYEFGYTLKESYYGDYLSFDPIYEDSCSYSFGGVGSGSREPGDFITSEVGFYTGDFGNFMPSFDTFSFDVAAPTLGGHPTTIQANNKYSINTQKWVNTTDNRDMAANDTFEAGKKYKLIVNYSSLYLDNQLFKNFESNQYYVGMSYYDSNVHIEHIGQFVASAYFYFGNKEDLNIDARVTLSGDKAPVAGQKISEFVVDDNIPAMDRTQSWSVARRVSSYYTTYDPITDPDAVFEAGKKYIYHISYDIEPGYLFNTFEVTNNNKNASFIEEDSFSSNSSYGSYAYYTATYKVVENGKTFGIDNQGRDTIFPNTQTWLKVYPSEKDEEFITWESSNEEIATVSGGWVYGLTPGNVTISATDDKGETATYDIKVGVPISTIEVSQPTLSMTVGDSGTLTAVVTPAVNDDSVSWMVNYTDGISYDNTPVSVSTDGEIYAIRPGTAEVIATTDSGKSASCTVTVTERAGVPVEKVTLNKTSAKIKVGQTVQLAETITPSNASDKNVIWISERPNIASVENGLVTGLEVGTTTITVQTSNGKTATCTVKVVDDFNVTFYDSDASTILAGPTAYESGTNANQIEVPNPSKPNQVLMGWYSDPGLTQYYDFTGTIDSNLNLYAKWEEIRVSIGVAPADVDFGEALTYFENNIERVVEVTNMGNVEVELDITNPTAQGPFGSMGIPANLILKPNEKYNARLIANKSGAQVGLAGTYNGNYIITAAYVKDDTKTATVNVPATLKLNQRPTSVKYKTHVQSYGWQDYKADGEMSGTSGEAKRLEAIQIKLDYSPYEGNIEYRTHIQSFGWENGFKKNDEMSGTSGQAKRLEAIQIKLTGEVANHYDVYYRVHAQSFGWLGWAKNGESAGTAAYAKRLEGIEIRLVDKDGEFAEYGEKIAFKDRNVPESITLDETNINLEAGSTAKLTATVSPEETVDKSVTWSSDNEDSVIVDQNGKVTAVYEGVATITAKTANDLTATCTVNVLPQIPGVSYKTHVQSFGWQDYVSDGVMSGTSGQAKRLEAIQIKLKAQPYTGDIEYRTHVQSYGWEPDFKKNDDMSGTSGQAKRLEAIEIRLTGEMAEHFDIYYRVHAQSFGWLNWAKNGEQAGTAGLAKRLEGIEIVLVEKGQNPPARDNQNDERSFIQNS